MEHVIELWKQYAKEKNRKTRDELILHYTGLVKYVVGRLAVGLPPCLQQQDLIGYGTLGLIEAIDRFDLNYGVKFETYAVARIRGQIIDSLRAMDLIPRSAYRHARQIEQAVAHLCQALGRSLTDEEVADQLEISLTQYFDWLANSNFSMASLDQSYVFDNGEQTTMYDAVEDTRMPTPGQLVDDKELKTQLVSAIKVLPEREQLMISLYYNEGLTMKEIGLVLEVSESRVSQIHAKAMLTLRGLLKSSKGASLPVYDRRGANAVYAIVS